MKRHHHLLTGVMFVLLGLFALVAQFVNLGA